MRVPLLALLPFGLGTLASLANAQFNDDVDAREIRARRVHDDSALELRDVIASRSTRELIDALSERLERRSQWYCSKCQITLSIAENIEHKFRSGHVTKKV